MLRLFTRSISNGFEKLNARLRRGLRLLPAFARSAANSFHAPNARLRLGLRVLVLLPLLALIPACDSEKERPADETQGLSALSGADTTGYARAYEPREFRFPADAGPHPDFKTEWWYWTGNLTAGDGRRFGYQFTVFRQALAPDSIGGSEWRSRQLYFAHLALSDIDGERFYPFERFSRGVAGLAGAQADPFRVWIDNWQASGHPDSVRLFAEQDGFGIDLSLRATKPRVLQGERGLSRKSGDPGNASYYYSRTRQETRGHVLLKGERVPITGRSWLDREWSTSVLAEEQSGWDWFSLQFDDGTELMLYQLRLRDGGVDPFSSGIFIDVDGGTQKLESRDFRIVPRNSWTSPRTGITWPSGWDISIVPLGMILRITPMQDDQEMPLSVLYWEGAVRVTGDRGGYGYVELTGYEE
jgi:predicted secreted hydrolase